MDFSQFTDAVEQRMESATGGPVTIDRTNPGAVDFHLADGTGTLTLVEDRAQTAIRKADGTVVTTHASVPLELTEENAAGVARFFASGGADDVV